MTSNKVRLIKVIFGSLAFFVLTYFVGNKIFKDNIEYNVFRTNAGWGYDILVNKKVFIHQEYVPVIVGNKPFPDKDSAKKTARLIIIKMKKGQIPAITQEDLKKLQI